LPLSSAGLSAASSKLAAETEAGKLEIAPFTRPASPASTQVVERRGNLAPVLGLVAGLIAVVGYFALVLRQDPDLTSMLETPLLFLGILAAGVVLSLVGLRRALSPGGRAGTLARGFAVVLGVANLALSALFCWYLFGYSYRLPAAVAAPALGSPAPAFTAADQTGEPFDLASQRGRNLLLVFYRGFW